jgi:hypothetical protein
VLIDVSNHLDASIAIGPSAHASGGQIALSNGLVRLTISANGPSCPSSDVVAVLNEIFEKREPYFMLRTAEANLAIFDDGAVVVNGQRVGVDPKILPKALEFLLSFCPLTKS